MINIDLVPAPSCIRTLTLTLTLTLAASATPTLTPIPTLILLQGVLTLTFDELLTASSVSPTNFAIAASSDYSGPKYVLTNATIVDLDALGNIFLNMKTFQVCRSLSSMPPFRLFRFRPFFCYYAIS